MPGWKSGSIMCFISLAKSNELATTLQIHLKKWNAQTPHLVYPVYPASDRGLHFVLPDKFRVEKENIWHICSHLSEKLRGNKTITATRFEPSALKLKLYLNSCHFSCCKRTSDLICQILTADSSDRIFHSLLSFLMSSDLLASGRNWGKLLFLLSSPHTVGLSLSLPALLCLIPLPLGNSFSSSQQQNTNFLEGMLHFTAWMLITI